MDTNNKTFSEELKVDKHQLTNLKSLTVDKTQLDYMESEGIDVGETIREVVQDTLGIPQEEFISVEILCERTGTIRLTTKSSFEEILGNLEKNKTKETENV